jgi:hypothetical protein
VWDLIGRSSTGELLVQVKAGAESYAPEVLERMHDSPDVLFVVPSELYDRLYEELIVTHPDLAGQLIELDISNVELDTEIENALEALSASLGFDLPDSIGELLPYLNEIILGIRLLLDIIAVERDLSKLSLEERARVHAVKALAILLRFGVSTVCTLAAGSAGGAVGAGFGSIAVPGLGTVGGAGIGAVIASIGGAFAASRINRRLVPYATDIGLKLCNRTHDDLFY